MKLSILAIASLLAALSPETNAQQPTAPKPPVGVPADSKLFNGKWYHVYLEQVQWHRAKEKCTSYGGQLAVVPDAATWDFIKSLSAGALWLGATDEKTEGVWQWVDQTPFTFSAWVTDNPNNTDGKEHYLAMFMWEKKPGWNDFPKDGKVRTFQVIGYICEWKVK